MTEQIGYNHIGGKIDFTAAINDGVFFAPKISNRALALYREYLNNADDQFNGHNFGRIYGDSTSWETNMNFTYDELLEATTELLKKGLIFFDSKKLYVKNYLLLTRYNTVKNRDEFLKGITKG